MSEPFHLLIADAAPLPDPPPLPALTALLARLRPAGSVAADDACPATPLELALARAHGLPGAPGRVPWAAFETGTVGTPCAWLTPCHWQLGLDHARLLDPAELALTESESRALLAAAAPLLAEDGVTLTYARPDAWLAQGELLRDLSTWSLSRALARPLTPDLLPQAPTPAHGARLRRLQAEVQMLLHAHPVNQADTRPWPVNALWIAGAGALDAPLPPNPRVHVERRLSPLPPEADAAQRRAAWQAIDAGSLTQLRRVLAGGGDARLTLCGPRRAVSCASARGLGAALSNLLKPLRLQNLLSQL